LVSNENILILGGAGLVGRHVASELILRGASVVLVDRSASVAEVAEKLGQKASYAVLDILAEGEFEKFVFGSSLDQPFSAAVNCVYPKNDSYGRKLESVCLRDFQSNLSSHVGAFFEVMRTVSQYMIQYKIKGSIINLASIYGVIAPRFQIYSGTNMTTPVEYVAIKSAIISLTKYYAQFYKDSGIRFNCISPGGIRDGQDNKFVAAYEEFCGPRGMLDPSDVCGAVCFLISEDSRFVNGQNLIVDDGFTL